MTLQLRQQRQLLAQLQALCIRQSRKGSFLIG